MFTLSLNRNGLSRCPLASIKAWPFHLFIINYFLFQPFLVFSSPQAPPIRRQDKTWPSLNVAWLASPRPWSHGESWLAFSLDRGLLITADCWHWLTLRERIPGHTNAEPVIFWESILQLRLWLFGLRQNSLTGLLIRFSKSSVGRCL